jgi:hypothetical protein
MMRIPMIDRDLPAVAAWLDELIVAVPGSDPLPILGSPGWIEAGPLVRLASLARYALGTLNELEPAVIAARLAAEIEAGRRDQATAMKQAAAAINEGGDWTAAARRPSQAELRRRRAEPGPLAGVGFDPDAAQRWVETGHAGQGGGLQT